MKKTFILSALLILNLFVIAQVGIGTKKPHASAMLEVTATNKGVLIPRMTLAQRNAIKSPANSLMIYQTDNTPGYYYYASNSWTRIANGNSSGGASNTFTAPLTLTGTTVSIPEANASTNGFLSAADWNKFNNVAPGTNVGDMLYWNGTGWVKLAAGKNGQSLVFCNGLPTWGGCPAVLTTSVVSEITATAATCGGEISDDGGTAIKDKGIVWSTTANPTISLTTKKSFGAGSENFSGTISGLEPSTVYYARAYATNNKGTSYGNEISFTTAAVDLTTGLVAFYPFTGDEGDSSGNGNNLLKYGNPEFINSIINGKNKLVINFPTGNDYYKTPQNFNSLVNNFQNGTVSFWLKLNSHYISNHYFGIDNSFFVKQSSDGEDLFFGIQAGSTKIRMQVTGVFPSSSNSDVIGATDLEIDRWYHVVGTWNGINHTLYLNGQMDGQIFNSLGISDRPNPLYTSLGSILYGGANDQGPPDALPSGAYGAISDFRFYNRALTQSEINYLATH